MSVVAAESLRLRTPADSAVSTPLVSVVVVNFCQWENTVALAGQLAESLSHAAGLAELFVIDNGSPDSPLSQQLADVKHCRLRRQRKNLGFARAVNEAALRTTGEWLLLLNPDTAVPPGFLDSLSALCRTAADDSARLGVIGLGLTHEDGTPQASAGPVPTFVRTLAGLLLPRRIRKCRHQRPADGRVGVDWVTGCGMLVRRDCWERLAGFDPDFFLYYEDADFCARARQIGWDVAYDPTLSLRHSHPLHTRSVPAELRLMTRHALLTFAAKRWRRWQSKALAGIVWAEASARVLMARLRGQSPAGHRDLRRLAADWWRGDVCAAVARVEATADTLQEVLADDTSRR